MTINSQDEWASAIEDAEQVMLRWGHGQVRRVPDEIVEAIVAALRAPVSERPLKMAYATPEAYAAVNPLGGPAVIFEAMAKRIRAGEDFYDVLDDYGLQSKFDERCERTKP